MKIAVNKKTLWTVIIVAVLIEPAYIAVNMSELDRIWDILKIISAFFILGYILKKKACSFIIRMQILFIGSLFVSTLLSRGDIKGWFLQNIYTLLLCWYLDTALQDNAKSVLQGMSFMLTVYVVVNLCSYLLFPDGMYVDIYNSPDCWFLGRDNSAALLLVSAMYISFLYSVYAKEKITVVVWLSNLSAHLFMLFVWSATSIVCMTVLIFFEIMIWNGKKIFVESMKRSVTAGTVIQLGIVGGGLQSVGIISFFIQDILKKPVDLAGRAPLWKWVISLIRMRPVWGYGIEDSAVKIARLGRKWAGTAHNYFLNIWYQGGLISGGILIIYILLTAGKFDKAVKSDRGRIIPAVMFVMMLMFTVEAYQGNVWFWVLLLFASHITQIENIKIRERGGIYQEGNVGCL